MSSKPNMSPEMASPTTGKPPVQLRRFRSPGTNLLAVVAPPLTEIHLTVTPAGFESPIFMAGRLAEYLHAWNATVVRLIIFGSVAASPALVAALRQSLDDPELPLTWVEGAACDGRPIAGIQVHAIAGARITTLSAQGQPHGRLWADAAATHCVFSGLGPRRVAANRAGQTRDTFETLQAQLTQAGMSLKNVARTWFFLDDILSWYDDFNRVRNDFFARTELRPGSVPASTGVSGRNPVGSAVTLAAWAVKPHNPASTVVRIVPSPNQCPAPAYGSAFSRAVEILSPGFRQILVSGTASIEPGGKTAHAGDAPAQIDLTMEVVESILESRGLNFADVSRATAYFRSGADAPLFAEWLERHELRSLPVINACCDICRDDLLFEIEVDAIKADG